MLEKLVLFIALSLFVTFASANSEKTIPYKILHKEELRNIKLSIDVQVPLIDGRLPNKKELGQLSEYLVSKERKHERVFVSFFLPGMQLGAGAFATAHHNPTMQVKILDMMLFQYPQYRKFLPY